MDWHGFAPQFENLVKKGERKKERVEERERGRGRGERGEEKREGAQRWHSRIEC